MSRRLSKRSLRAMRDQWQRHLDRLEAEPPTANDSWVMSMTETVRNLGTAIAWVDGLITGDPTFKSRAGADDHAAS